MTADEIKIKYIGGPTALLEIGGLRILTDPTFDAAGTTYETSIYILRKLMAPSVNSGLMGPVDYVFLSHDHHFDNLDRSGREFLSRVNQVITTPAGAERLGGNSIGIHDWETIEIPTRDGRILSITGTPCRHGPVGGDRGPVTGFVVFFKGDSSGGVYITGDTVYYEGVEQVAQRFDIGLVVLFMGAAIVKNVGAAHLTMTVEESILTTRLFAGAKIVPLHYEGWEHFTESRVEIESKYREAGLYERLSWAGA